MLCIVLLLQLAPTLVNGSKFDQDEYVKALEKLLVAITFLENHRSYEGSAKALEQAKELLVQAKKKCKADFVSAVGILSRGSRDNSNSGALVWSTPNKKESAKVAQLLHCLLSSNIDQAELLTEYGKQRFQVVKMAMCEEETTLNSIGFRPATETMSALATRLKDVEVSIEAEKKLAAAIFPTEELSHAAFRYAAYPILDALRADLDAALQQTTQVPSSSTFPSVSSSLSTSGASAAATTAGGKQLDPFKLLLLHELFVGRVSDFEALISPPLLLRDRKGVGRDDPWVLSKSLTVVVSSLATVTKQKLFGFQFELTDHISAGGDRSFTKDGNVHPVSSYVSFDYRPNIVVCESCSFVIYLLCCCVVDAELPPSSL